MYKNKYVTQQSNPRLRFFNKKTQNREITYNHVITVSAEHHVYESSKNAKNKILWYCNKFGSKIQRS